MAKPKQQSKSKLQSTSPKSASKPKATSPKSASKRLATAATAIAKPQPSISKATYTLKGLSIHVETCSLSPVTHVESQAAELAGPLCPFPTCRAFTTCRPAISMAEFRFGHEEVVLPVLLDQLAIAVQNAKTRLDVLVMTEDEAGARKFGDAVKKLGGTLSRG